MSTSRSSWPLWRPMATCVAFGLLWPLGSAAMVPDGLRATTLFSGVPAVSLVAAGLFVALQMAVEFGVVAAVLIAVARIGARLAPARDDISVRRQLALGLCDAALVASALTAGIALELPAIFGRRFLHPYHGVSVATASAVALGLACVPPALTGVVLRSAPAAARGMALAAVIVASGWGLARHVPTPVEAGAAAPRQVIVLGLDSLSFSDDLTPLRTLAADHAGAFYTHATTPGLLTNAVWPAILTSRRPSEVGTYFVFQAPDWGRLPPTLVARAKARGMDTWSYFSDQFTLHAGSDLGFDHDRSGPRGWKQPVTAALKDASIFLPVVLPWLPDLPGAGTPANQAGTYAFSLRRELAEVLGGPRASGGALVLGHVDYLHQARFPGMSDLTPQERAAVWAAPISGVIDHSLDWQSPRADGDPLDLYRWKVRHLLDTLARAVRHTGVLDRARGNTLVLFSDHGNRTGVREGEFGVDGFYHVPLVTFGTKAAHPDAPTSLLDIASLVGLPDPDRTYPTPPVVEYVNVTPEEWGALIAASRPRADGGIDLDRAILTRVGKRLLAFAPTDPAAGYRPVPTRPTATRPEPASALSRLVALAAGP